jgi:hypothetical protein
VREHRTEDALQTLDGKNLPSTKKGKVHKVYKKQNRSLFRLSNREWASNCGRLLNRSRSQKLSQSLLLQGSIDLLAAASARTGFSAQYTKHVNARVATAPRLQTRMRARAPRRWKFESYQKEQRAVNQLRADLLDGLSPANTLMVWGNGGFGPTSKGHDSSPNKKMQRALSRWIPVVTSSEYRSSKTSCCCHCPVRELKSQGQKTRSVAVQCVACKTLLGRDTNAAAVIADIFRSPGLDLPSWISDHDTREANSVL